VTIPSFSFSLLDAMGVLVSIVAGALAFRKYAKTSRKSEIHDGLILALNNGGGDVVAKIVTTSISAALDNHQIRCPIRPLVESMEERLITLERV
jgi:hypothetical protein